MWCDSQPPPLRLRVLGGKREDLVPTEALTLAVRPLYW